MAIEAILSEVSGTVWKIEVKVGDRVGEGDTLIILESMKMEIPVETPANGVIVEILVAEEDVVQEDQPLAIIEA